MKPGTKEANEGLAKVIYISLEKVILSKAEIDLRKSFDDSNDVIEKKAIEIEKKANSIEEKAGAAELRKSKLLQENIEYKVHEQKAAFATANKELSFALSDAIVEYLRRWQEQPETDDKQDDLTTTLSSKAQDSAFWEWFAGAFDEARKWAKKEKSFMDVITDQEKGNFDTFFAYMKQKPEAMLVVVWKLLADLDELRAALRTGLKDSTPSELKGCIR